MMRKAGDVHRVLFHVKHHARQDPTRPVGDYAIPRHPSGSTPPGTGAPSSYG